MLVTPVRKFATKAPSLAQQAHQKWVKYFNQHQMMMTMGDNWVDYQQPIRKMCGGVGSPKTLSTFDQVKKDMYLAFAHYKKGDKKKCGVVLDILDKNGADFDVFKTFKEVFLGKKSKENPRLFGLIK